MITLRRSVGRLSHSPLGSPKIAGLVAAVEVGRARRELGGAGVDPLEHRPHAQRPAPCAHRRPRRRPVSWASRRSEKPSALSACRTPRPRAARRAAAPPRSARGPGSGPGTTGRRRRRPGSRPCSAPRGRPARSAAAGRASAAPGRPASRPSAGRSPARPGTSISSRPHSPVSSPRSAFCSDSLKVRPIAMTSPTDFIAVVSSGSVSGNFSKVKRGILVTT